MLAGRRIKTRQGRARANPSFALDIVAIYHDSKGLTLYGMKGFRANIFRAETKFHLCETSDQCENIASRDSEQAQHEVHLKDRLVGQ